MDDTKVQLENTKIQLEDAKSEISDLGKKLAEIVEYTKAPCINCNGPTFCLDGQVVGKSPGNGTRITTLKNFCTKYNYGVKEVTITADDTGTVDTGYNPPYVNWNTSKASYCQDFTVFVYKCK